MKYLLDTNILRYYAARHPTLVDHLDKRLPEEIGLPFIVLVEHLRGRFDALLKAEPKNILREQERLRDAQNLLRDFEVVYLNEKAVAEFTNLRRRVSTRKRHTDVVIAAMALADDHIVVTRNVNDFKDLLPAARIQNWIDHVY
jgi:predicted nucleic acid-binding protein